MFIMLTKLASVGLLVEYLTIYTCKSGSYKGDKVKLYFSAKMLICNLPLNNPIDGVSDHKYSLI